MAKVSNKAATMFFNLVLVLSLFLILSSMAEGSRLFGVRFGKVISALECDTVYGAQSGDTCFGITQMFNLTSQAFTKFNPNLVCDNLFAGQWICVEGAPAN